MTAVGPPDCPTIAFFAIVLLLKTGGPIAKTALFYLFIVYHVFTRLTMAGVYKS